MGRDKITTECKDAKVLDRNLIEKFDAVLCDAPCSGIGVMNDNPDIKLNRDEINVKELNKEQLAILKTVCNYVKVGGYLYYSTCSILSSENISIINTFMSDINGFEICKIDSKLQHEELNGTNFKFLFPALSPYAVTTETLAPVQDPGPTPTSTTSTSPRLKFNLFKTTSIAGNKFSVPLATIRFSLYFSPLKAPIKSFSPEASNAKNFFINNSFL